MNRIDLIIFPIFFKDKLKTFNDRFINKFYTNIERIENNCFNTSRFRYRYFCLDYEFRYFRMGRYRIIFIYENWRITLLDIMERKINYDNKYLDRLLSKYNKIRFKKIN